MNDDPSNANNTLYILYKNVRPCWPLVISALAINLVALAGMIMNFGVIWVTFRTKTLHGTANFLLALCSFFELLHQHGHLLFLYIAVSGINFLPYSTAVHFCTVSLFGLGSIAISMTFTGLDRLLCVLIPAFPKKVSPLPYLTVVVLICVAFAVRNVMDFYETAAEMPDLLVTGTIGDLMQGQASLYYSIITLVLNTITILLYLIVGLVIRVRSVSNSSTSDQTNRRTFRSLFIIIVLNVGGYYLTMIFLLFVMPIIQDPIQAWTILMLLAIVTVNISAASNGPILYMTSKEYRKAFHREFPFIHRLVYGIAGSSTVQPKSPALGPAPHTVTEVPSDCGGAAHHHRTIPIQPRSRSTMTMFVVEKDNNILHHGQPFRRQTMINQP